MQWDSWRNNKRACWWEKGGALLESFLFITEVSPWRERWWISFGSFVLCLSLNTQDCCSPWVWRTRSRNGKTRRFTEGRKGAKDDTRDEALIHLLINTFITFCPPAVPVLWCLWDVNCSPMNHRNALFRNRCSSITIQCISDAGTVESNAVLSRL